MSKRPSDYTLFEKKIKDNQKVWCVYFRDDETGERLNPIYVSKLKKLLYKGKHGLEPIVNRDECIKIVEKSLTKDNIRDYIFNKKKPSSPNFIEFVRMVWDYDNSPYIKGRLKEGNSILKHTYIETIVNIHTWINKYTCIINKRVFPKRKNLFISILNKDFSYNFIEGNLFPLFILSFLL